MSTTTTTTTTIHELPKKSTRIVPRRSRTSFCIPELTFKVPTRHEVKKVTSSVKSALHACSEFDIYRSYSNIRKASIICTIGPKTKSVKSLQSLVEAGMDIVRLNFSHGTHEYHAGVIANVKTVREQLVKENKVLGLALDTKGPEIRTGLVKDGGEIKLSEGDVLTVTTDDAFKDKCDEKNIYLDYKNIAKVMQIDDLIYIDDGLLSLKVTSIADDEKSLEVVTLNAATISSKKGVNLPNVEVDLPALSEKDKRDIKFGLVQGIDMIFASFIRKAEDIKELRELLGKDGENVKIISKIENHEGVQKFDEILKESDGIMVARGDLGIEIPPHKVFIAQKMMISKCNIAGKPVIVATQMLESMTYNPRPTRAEVSDVSNAVLDGADCVMLSGETAKGDYPCESVQMMSEICLAAESAFQAACFTRQLLDLEIRRTLDDEICAGAVKASRASDVKLIFVTSVSGRMAQLISKYRPQVPIIMITTNPMAARCAKLSYGIYPYVYDKIYDQNDDFSTYVNAMMISAMMFAKEMEILKNDDKVVVVQGAKAGRGHTNTMRIITYSTQQT